MLCVFVSPFVLAFWSPRLGLRELVFLLLVHLFVCFARVCFCPFSLPLGVEGWLRFVIVAYPRSFYYFFYQISHIASQTGEWIMAFFYSGCYGNLQLPLTYNGGKCVKSDIYIYFYLTAWRNAKLEKQYSKIISWEAIRGTKLKLWGNVSISLYKLAFLFPLLMCFCCYGNLKFPLIYNGESENLAFIAKVLQKCSLSSPLPNITFLSKPLNLIGWHGERLNLRKKYSKTISSEAIRGTKLKFCRNNNSISLWRFLFPFHVLLLLWQLKVSIDL